MADQSLEDSHRLFTVSVSSVFHDRAGGPLAGGASPGGSSGAEWEVEDGEVTHLAQPQAPQDARATGRPSERSSFFPSYTLT